MLEEMLDRRRRRRRGVQIGGGWLDGNPEGRSPRGECGMTVEVSVKQEGGRNLCFGGDVAFMIFSYASRAGGLRGVSLGE
ncbi:hypothetical protein CBR_g19760 [Chara braunii]|uniref:Uncharacterized protein n=1 Tax=Chara braunii TaxID=69332 RepID=A0A388JTX7_CHABU|nr:hypothetical protein CBR_g19760 [Chara braunii]|eukprot:GBG61227.1 hypothetical protein CBR_g19760 [Chara braunii]